MSDLIEVRCGECSTFVSVPAGTKMHHVGPCPSCECDAWTVNEPASMRQCRTIRAAEKTGVPTSTLLWWARTGVVSPARVHSAHIREYRQDSYVWSNDDIDRVAAIKAMRDEGITLKAAVEKLA